MPHAKVLAGVDLDKSQPSSMLGYDKNCVAMTFSRLLGVGVYATVNFFLQKGWIKNASDLEHDNAIDTVVGHLSLEEKYENTSWATVKTGMKGHPDGRYFAVNRGANTGATGHAFAIIINQGSVGVYGNNAEKKNNPYHSQINDSHKISVYGPIGT
jgi:hypothetical protein